MIDPKFTTINRLFVLSCKNEASEPMADNYTAGNLLGYLCLTRISINLLV